MTAAIYFRMFCLVLCLKTYRLLGIRNCTLLPVGYRCAIWSLTRSEQQGEGVTEHRDKKCSDL
jgi:hypothetical protein